MSQETPSSPRNVTLQVEETGSISQLENTFGDFESALIEQKGKLRSNWISHQHSAITIDVHRTLEFISNIGIDIPSYHTQQDTILSLLYNAITKLSQFNNNAIEIIRNNASKTTTTTTTSTTATSSMSNTESKKKRKKKKKSDLTNNDEKTDDSVATVATVATTEEEKELEAEKLLVKDALAKGEPQLKLAKEAVSAIDDSTLNELLSFSNPPPIVVKVLTVVAYVISESDLMAPSSGVGGSGRNTPRRSSRSRSSSRERGKSPKTPSTGGAGTGGVVSPRFSSARGMAFGIASGNDNNVDMLKQPWKEIKAFLKSYNLTQQITLFDARTVDYKVYKRIEKDFLSLDDVTVDRANKASKALGPIVQWISSCVEYGKIWHKMQPMIDKIEKLEKELAMKKLQNKIDEKMSNRGNSVKSEKNSENAFSFDNENENENETENEASDVESDAAAREVKGISKEEIELQVSKMNEEHESIGQILGELEGKLKVMFDNANEKEKESMNNDSVVISSDAKEESNEAYSGNNNNDNIDSIREIIESTIKSVLSTETVKTLSKTFEETTKNVVKHEVAQSQSSIGSSDDILKKKDLINILPFNDVIESIKSIENKMREIKMISESTNEDISKNLRKIENDSVKTHKFLIENVNKIESDVNKSSENIFNELNGIRGNISKSIKISDTNNEIISKNLNKISETIETLNVSNKERSEKMTETILKYIEVINNSVTSLNKSLDTTLENLNNNNNNNKLIVNEKAQSSNDGDNDSISMTRLQELEEIRLNKIEGAIIDARKLISSKIDKVNGDYINKLNELHNAMNDNKNDNNNNNNNDNDSKKMNELMKEYMSSEMKEVKIEFETFFSRVNETIEGLKREYNETGNNTVKLKKDISSLNTKLDSIQFEQQLLRQQQSESEQQRQIFFDKLEKQQKEFLLKQEKLLSIENKSDNNGSKKKKKGKYETVNDEEESPLLTEPKVLPPAAYILARDWCCGVVCCFKYACGTSGNCCSFV